MPLNDNMVCFLFYTEQQLKPHNNVNFFLSSQLFSFSYYYAFCKLVLYAGRPTYPSNEVRFVCFFFFCSFNTLRFKNPLSTDTCVSDRTVLVYYTALRTRVN